MSRRDSKKKPKRLNRKQLEVQLQPEDNIERLYSHTEITRKEKVKKRANTISKNQREKSRNT